MKNEADIVGSTVEHLFRQGIDFVLIADHSSTDETVDVVSSVAEDHAVGVFRVDTAGFFQEESIMTLARIARKNGARWILPFDADEYWFAEEGSVRDYLQSQAANIVYASGSNLFPLVSPSRSPIWLDGELDLGTRNYRKVTFRSSPFAYVHHGNHDVVRRGRSVHGLRIAHAPIRDFDQMLRKVRQGAQSMRAAGLLGRGRHWHALDRLAEEELEAYWFAIGQRKEWEVLGWKPVGPYLNVRIAGATDWRALVGESGL